MAPKDLAQTLSCPTFKQALMFHIIYINELENLMIKNNVWDKSFELDVGNAPEQIWQAFADTSNWKQWNSGVKSIKIEGPFVSGTWFSMELPEGEIIRSQLIDVSEGKHFIDETWVGVTCSPLINTPRC